tara:strand:- start:460 stop:1203 length:744 start_codon:yes stop_codon:yes gene_type:complete
MPIITILLSAFILTNCASTPDKLQGAEHYYAEGKKAFDKNRCIEASENFQRLVSNFPGSRRVAEAQYFLAESFFCSADYVNAVFEYQRLIDIYPASERVEEAQYKIGESNYQQMRNPQLDQKETYETLIAFRNFIEENPSSSKVENARARIAECRENLAEKLFQAGYLYQRQGYLEAARILFNDLVRDYIDTPSYYRTLFHLGEIARDTGDNENAIEYWNEVLQDSEDTDLKSEVEEALPKLSESVD